MVATGSYLGCGVSVDTGSALDYTLSFAQCAAGLKAPLVYYRGPSGGALR